MYLFISTNLRLNLGFKIYIDDEFGRVGVYIREMFCSNKHDMAKNVVFRKFSKIYPSNPFQNQLTIYKYNPHLKKLLVC